MSSSDTVNPILTVNRQLASYFSVGKSATAEGAQSSAPRCSPYSEMMMQSVWGARTPGLADEGSLWIGTNVPGTPIIDTAALTAFVATTPTMTIFNGNTVASNKFLYPLRFKAQVTAAGTNGTNWLGQWLIDTGNRYTSGGTTITPVNANLGVANASTAAVVKFGAITAPAANASRIVHSAGYRTVLKVIGDIVDFRFGETAPVTTGMPMEGTLQLNQVVAMPALAIPPQCSLLWYEYAASQSVAASFDYLQLEYVER
jgi:hypothetical protein